MIRITLPYIKTPRLRLRELRRTDAPRIFQYAADPDVGPMAGWEPHQTLDDSYRFVDYAIKKKDFGQPGVFVIELNDTGELIGTIEIHSYRGYKGEIGFVLAKKHWNKGYVTEAAKAVIIYAMEILELKRLTYCHFPHNAPSKRVCEKLGFSFEGVLRKKFLLYDGSLMDDVTYSIIDEDYFSGKLPWVEPFKKDHGPFSENICN